MVERASLTSPLGYAANDIELYLVEHPIVREGTVWRIASVEGRTLHLRDLSQKLPNSTMPLNELTWGDLKLPVMGYRHVADCSLLVFVTLSAIQQARKGLVPARVQIETQAVPRDVNNFLLLGSAGHSDYVEQVYQALYNPVFLSLEEAIPILMGKGEAVGVALSPSLAVFLTASPTYPFALGYNTTTVAVSADGIKWKFTDESVRKQLQPKLKLVA